MTYWTIIPAAEERKIRQTKVFKQFNKPKPTSDRVKNYPWIHGFPTKNAAIEHLNKMDVPNEMRPDGFKTYDIRK
jgi:hypothetical protein